VAKQRRLFCEINPFFYYLSEQKQILMRKIKNFKRKKPFSNEKSKVSLPDLIYKVSSKLIKTGPGVDPVLQYNKVDNIKIASEKIDGIIIKPGEEFSWWSLVGKTNSKNGYKKGRLIERGKVIEGYGGGLCNLANTINLLILHSPLNITEFHMHTDALSPDAGKRVPLANGTSILYNYLDYRFTNNTDQDFQLKLYLDDTYSYGELRAQKELDYHYDILEEDLRYEQVDGKYYRKSMIYKITLDKSDQIVAKDLIVKNNSEVMFDYNLIPKEQIR